MIIDEIHGYVRMPKIENLVFHLARFLPIFFCLLSFAGYEIRSELIMLLLVFVEAKRAVNNLKTWLWGSHANI